MRSPALLLIAHGSSDPDWRHPIDEVFAQVERLAPDRPARLCFLEHTEPNFHRALQSLVDEGVRHVRVVALLLSSTGRHFRRDLPALVHEGRVAHPHLTLELDPAAVGTHAYVIRAMAEAAVAGHGSDQ